MSEIPLRTRSEEILRLFRGEYGDMYKPQEVTVLLLAAILDKLEEMGGKE